MPKVKKAKENNRAVYHHALNFYDELSKLAQKEKAGQQTLLVFRGKLSAVYHALGISQSYYAPVRMILEHNGVIEHLQSGSRGIDSVVLLHKRPKSVGDLVVPPDLKDSPPKALTDDPNFARLVDRVEGLEILVGGVDIGKMLLELDGRLKKLGA